MVRVGTPSAVARPAWYDRNPTTQNFYISVLNQAPHTTTERFSRTIPAGKKAMVEVGQCSLVRRTAATTLQAAQAFLSITPSGGYETPLLTAHLFDNTVGARADAFIGQSVTLNAGDIIKGYTFDSSTGGAIDYNMCLKITEFDA